MDWGLHGGPRGPQQRERNHIPLYVHTDLWRQNEIFAFICFFLSSKNKTCMCIIDIDSCLRVKASKLSFPIVLVMLASRDCKVIQDTSVHILTEPYSYYYVGGGGVNSLPGLIKQECCVLYCLLWSISDCCQSKRMKSNLEPNSHPSTWALLGCNAIMKAVGNDWLTNKKNWVGDLFLKTSVHLFSWPSLCPNSPNTLRIQSLQASQTCMFLARETRALGRNLLRQSENMQSAHRKALDLG